MCRLSSISYFSALKGCVFCGNVGNLQSENSDDDLTIPLVDDRHFHQSEVLARKEDAKSAEERIQTI